MKEKTLPITIRLPESRVFLIRDMAKAFGVTTSKLASVMLETGFVMVDEVEKKNKTERKTKAKNAKKDTSKNG